LPRRSTWESRADLSSWHHLQGSPWIMAFKNRDPCKSNWPGHGWADQLPSGDRLLTLTWPPSGGWLAGG
jgi:hypothetical protein